MIFRQLGDNPIDPALQGLRLHRTTGFANGRQRPPSPVLRTTLLQRAPQETLRCTDERHVAGLPCAAAHLTVSQPQWLLAVPMERLGACPPMPIHPHETHHCPPQPIAPQGCTRLLVASLTPQHDDPHGMSHFRNAQWLAHIPLSPPPHAHGLLRGPRHLASDILPCLLAALIDHLAVQLQIAPLPALRALDMIAPRGTGARALERAVPRHLPLPHVINQRDTPCG